MILAGLYLALPVFSGPGPASAQATTPGGPAITEPEGQGSPERAFSDQSADPGSAPGLPSAPMPDSPASTRLVPPVSGAAAPAAGTGAASGTDLGDASATAASADDAAPRRVVSMNLCTDQLAMLVAAPGQLVSVSVLARDPLSSAMADAAAAYPVNHGLAEELFLLRPDLVLTEPWTRPATVELLRRLGVPVAVIEPASSVADIPRALRQTGAALGQEARARQLADDFADQLAALSARAPAAPDRAALYQASGYTSGPQTLAGDILAAAGLSNIAAELGMSWGGHLPLEQLVMAEPDLILRSLPYPGRSHAEEILDHPALTALRRQRRSADIRDAGWICGTPAVLMAIAELIELRRTAPAPGAASLPVDP